MIFKRNIAIIFHQFYYALKEGEMKELYNKPEIEITIFETEDVITTSVTEDGDNIIDEGDQGWWG